MPGVIEPLSEQLVVETSVCGCQRGIQPKAPGAPGGLELDYVQDVGAGSLRHKYRWIVFTGLNKEECDCTD